jgi:hypothetical protein
MVYTAALLFLTAWCSLLPGLQEVADQQLLSKHVQLWQQRVVEGKVERAEALRGAVSNKVLLVRRAWRAWWQFVRTQHAAQAAAAAAVQHRKQVCTC